MKLGKQVPFHVYSHLMSFSIVNLSHVAHLCLVTVMLVLLSFTTETNLFSRAARVMSLNSAVGPQIKKIPSLNTLETRADKGWAVKRALRSSFNV